MARVELSCQGYTREYKIDHELLIGRGESCDVKIPSIKASRDHCRIFKATGGYFLEDLGSVNGTLHNGVLIGRKLLKHNDEIEVGRIKLRFIDKTEDPLIGRRLGHYQIIEKIGGGAEGTVYHGRQLALKRDVAVKLLRDDFVRRKGGGEELQRIFSRALDFEHENIVRIYEFVEDKGNTFFAMELVSGENLLGRLIRKQHLRVAEVVKYALSICSALVSLHEGGVLHGDIKPHNIIITHENTVKLVDLSWGELSGAGSVAKEGPFTIESEDETEESREEMNKVFATPQYVAPELIRHEPQSEASDIYALSVTLYQLLTGSLPYTSEHIEELLKQHLQGEVRNPRELNSKIPPALAELILAGMKPDIAERIGSAREYQQQLEKIAAQLEKKNKQKRQVVMKRLGKRRLGFRGAGLVYKLLIVLVFLLLAGSYGVRRYREYVLNREEQHEQQLKLGGELYVQGEYEKAAGLLNKLLAENPQSEVAEQAQKTIGLLQLPDGVKELQKLQQSMQQGDIPKSKVITKVREVLRRGELDDSERKEYLAFLKSIGGDTDVRYSWQKRADELLVQDNLLGVYEMLVALSSEEWSEFEGAEYTKYLNQITDELAVEIEHKYEYAGELLKSGRVLQARGVLAEVVNKYPAALGWRKRILEFYAQSNEELVQRLTEHFGGILRLVAKLDESGIREEIFRFQESTSRQAGVVDISGVLKIPVIIGAFKSGVMQSITKIESRTGRAVPLEVMLDGHSEMLGVSVRNNRLLASTGESTFELEVVDILLSSIEKIMPAFEVTPAQAAGAGLYFIARGDLNTGKGYLQSLLSGGNSDFSHIAGEYLQLLNGRIGIPLRTGGGTETTILAASSTRLAGSSMVLPVAPGEYVFETSSQGRFRIKVQESALVLEFDSGVKKELLGEAIIQPQEKGSIEIKGYWDRIIVSQNDIMVGSIAREALGGTVIAPISGSRGKMELFKGITISWPSEEREKVVEGVGLG